MPKKGISKSDISSIGKPGLYVVVSSGVNRRCSVKKDYSKISQISQEITCIGVLFCGRPCKETPVQVVSCEFCEIFKTRILYNISEHRLLLNFEQMMKTEFIY